MESYLLYFRRPGYGNRHHHHQETKRHVMDLWFCKQYDKQKTTYNNEGKNKRQNTIQAEQITD